jgi:hypothetical protein
MYLHFPVALQKAVQNLATQAGRRRGGVAFAQQVHHRTHRLGVNYNLQCSLPAGRFEPSKSALLMLVDMSTYDV